VWTAGAARPREALQTNKVLALIGVLPILGAMARRHFLWRTMSKPTTRARRHGAD
jgi:hypothetical protein